MIKIIYGLLETNHVCIYIYILYFKNELTIYLREREREGGGGLVTNYYTQVILMNNFCHALIEFCFTYLP